MSFRSFGWHVCPTQIEGGALVDEEQVKHLQAEFEESKGGFISQQKQRGGAVGGGVVALKLLCCSSF